MKEKLMATINEAVGTQHELVLERMDVRQTAKVLGAMVTYLDAEETIRRAQGIKDESELLKTVREEHERLKALIVNSRPGTREAFLDGHQLSYDMLDGIYDCASDDCPNVGYKSPEDRALHHSMWGFDNPLIDIRNTLEEY